MIHFNWNNSIKVFFPIQKELLMIRNDITEAHLWFEEMVSGDTLIDKNHDILIPFAHKHFKNYLKDVKEKKLFEHDSSILVYLDDIDEQLDILYTLAIYRLENLELSGIGSVNDQFFDEEFNLCLFAIDTAILHIGSNLENEIADKNDNFKYIIFLFFITNIIIFLMILITRNRNLKQAKMISEQSKMVSMGEMIGNIAHQWRQPLSIISTGVTGMQVQKKYSILSDATFEQTCNTINKNAQYLSTTIDDFRDYIKGDSVKIKFNINDEIKSFLSLVDTTITKYKIEVFVDVKKKMIICYKNELTQCLINIFNNSKDAFVENKKIVRRFIFINVVIKKGVLVLKIKDNAGGIPKKVLKKIYEPYFTTKHQSQGTGLGLHMTYNLIHNTMKGEITANNLEYFFNDIRCNGVEFIIKIPLK